jgi:hypothetical protein
MKVAQISPLLIFVAHITTILFTDDGNGSIKDNLVDELNYVLVPSESWDLLVQWYGTVDQNTAISRQVSCSLFRNTLVAAFMIHCLCGHACGLVFLLFMTNDVPYVLVSSQIPLALSDFHQGRSVSVIVGGCRGACYIFLSYIIPSTIFMSHFYHFIFILYVFLNLPSSLYLAATLVCHWFTDSLSAFQSLHWQTPDHLDLLEVLQEVCHLHMARKLCSILLDTWPHRSARE